MTENEALGYLKNSKRQKSMLGILPGSDIGNTIIKALEELKQYRTIGTPEECRAAKCTPTAYDPDKVVEQLEKRRMDALRRMNENRGTAFGYASERVYNAWNDAIEIVKGGGIDG